MMIGHVYLINKHVTDYRTLRTTMMIGLYLINKHVTIIMVDRYGPIIRRVT